MDKFFKVGDRVILVDAAGIFTLEKYQSYEVADFKYQLVLANNKRDQFIRLSNDEEFYNSRRFKKDVKYVRRKKIEEMKWKENKIK